jgi:DNA-binding response OmpR family regulator
MFVGNKKILIIEDEPSIAQLLDTFLSRNNFLVKIHSSVGGARQIIQEFCPELILLDRNLPDGDGMQIIAIAKSIGDIKIILVTGNSEQIEKIISLELGADDYITKPFDLRELLARIKAVLRRGNKSSPVPENNNALVMLDNWVYDKKNGMLTKDEITIHLTGAELMLLNSLLENYPQTVSKEKLSSSAFNQAWTPDSRKIDMLASSLRKKLGDDHHAPKYIKTIRNFGYKLVCSVRAL